MNKIIFILLIGTFLSENILSQSWVQTSSTPIGGGVTDLLVRENGDILATVGSFNWPSVAGGVRKSTDDGHILAKCSQRIHWKNNRRSFHGNLYASIWFYPQNEGLYAQQTKEMFGLDPCIQCRLPEIIFFQ